MFKYEIGDEVYFRLYRENCVVERQLLAHSIDGTSKLYDLAVVGRDNARQASEVYEEWLDPGHKIE